MAGWLRSAGARYVQLGLYSGDASKGEKGLGIFPDRRDEFRASVTEALDYAEAVGASMVHAMAGILPPRSGLSITGTATSRTSPSPPRRHGRGASRSSSKR